jgi:uncharacterized repeat protein (TIGR03803 family)
LVQGTDGALYGTAFNGGPLYGTIYKLNTDGTDFAVLKRFVTSFDVDEDGGYPIAGLTQGADGAFYGTAPRGGRPGLGTVFKMTADLETVTALHTFDSATTGTKPYAKLIQGTDGTLYGTTSEGGSGFSGTVYKLNPDGTGFTVLHNFDLSTTGGLPYAGLLQGADGALYGTTPTGGSSTHGTAYKLNPDGTGFTVLKHFDGNTSGGQPYGGLMQATDGALYGAAYTGGGLGFGTVFRLNPDGTGFTVLHHFDPSTASNIAGGYLYAGLVQGTGGALYGTTSQGGPGSAGTIFRFLFDSDRDADEIDDGRDNCPSIPNPDQADTDADGIGDVCDICPLDPQNDADGDGVCGNVDNCPNQHPGALDINHDGCTDSVADLGQHVELEIGTALQNAISEILASPTIPDAAAKPVKSALDGIIGNNGGIDNNGAADAFVRGDLVAGITKMRKAIQDLQAAAAKGFNTTALQRQITEIARLAVLAGIGEASVTLGATHPAIVTAQNRLAQGDALLATGNYPGALDKYKAAAQALP